MKVNPIALLVDKILNVGTKKTDDVVRTQLIRQINGLNSFYTLVALFVGILLTLFVPGAGKVAIIQLFATIFYFTGILIVAAGRIKLAGKMTIFVFEWHLFSIMVLTNMWDSPAIFIVVLYPLLAALVERSIFRHLFISLLQIFILKIIHAVFPDIQSYLFNFSHLEAQASEALKFMAVGIIPVMAAVVIFIIFSENLRAREKQKKMLNELSCAHKQLEYYAGQLEDEAFRLRAEVKVAKKIQTIILPSTDDTKEIRELDIAFIMRTAEEIGGDYYDFIKINDRIIIGMGDVTGHGLHSGIIMLMAQTAIRSIAEFALSKPSEMIEVLNRILFSNISRIKEDRDMTLLIIYYMGTGKYILSGQHESPLICRNNGEIELIDTIDLGFYVGMLPDISTNMQNVEFTLQPGEILLLYTDGITEAVNEKDEQYGLDRLKKVVEVNSKLSAETIKNKIVKDVYNFMAYKVIMDDISLVVVKQK